MLNIKLFIITNEAVFCFYVIPVQFLQPQFICFAAVKRLSVFVSEQEE